MIINKKTILPFISSLLSLTMIPLIFGLFVSDASAAATCPSTWQPAYAVDCIDPAYPYACGFSASGLPQCKASLPTTTCNGGTIDYNCNSCTASCQCPSGQILCSGTCKEPLSNSACTTQNREVDPCTGTCGACKTGYTDCSGTCKLSSSPTCVSPNVYNPCTGACTAPTRYIEASPAAVQNDFINISKGVLAASSTMVGSGYFGGEAMFGSYWNGVAMTSPITLSSGKNLLYGQINSGSTGGNLMLLEKGTGGTASPLFAINYSGRVGIGISNPGQMLHIQGASTTWSGLRINREGDPTYFEILHYGGTGSGTTLRQSGNMPIRFFTNGVDRMSITGSGRVGIGTLSPNRTLHVSSTVENAEIDIQSGGKNHWAIYHDFGSEDLRFWNTDAGGSNALILSNTGNAYVAGEFKSSWLHVTSTDPNSFNSMANRLVVGLTQAREDYGDVNTASKKATLYALNNQPTYSGPTPNSSDQQATAIFGRSFYGHAGAFSNGFSSATTGNWSTLVAQNFNPVNTVSALYAENLSTQPSSKAVQGISNSGWSGYFTGTPSTSKGVFATRLCLGSETDCKTSWSAVGGMPGGVAGQTLRNDGTNWVATSNLYNNGINIGIGTTAPNRLLHIASSTGNAEIDIQSGGKNHWAIYHDAGTEDLRLYNGDVSGGDALKIKNVGDLFVARNIYASGEIKGAYLHASSTTGISTIGHTLSISGNLCLGGVCKGAWPAGGVYVGRTASFGANQGGYGIADSRCNAAFSGSHVCSNEEMFNSMRTGVTLPSRINVWVNSGPNALSNDCVGWTSNNYLMRGAYWALAGSSSIGYTLDCSQSLPFACCK